MCSKCTHNNFTPFIFSMGPKVSQKTFLTTLDICLLNSTSRCHGLLISLSEVYDAPGVLIHQATFFQSSSVHSWWSRAHFMFCWTEVCDKLYAITHCTGHHCCICLGFVALRPLQSLWLDNGPSLGHLCFWDWSFFSLTFHQIFNIILFWSESTQWPNACSCRNMLIVCRWVCTHTQPLSFSFILSLSVLLWVSRSLCVVLAVANRPSLCGQSNCRTACGLIPWPLTTWESVGLSCRPPLVPAMRLSWETRTSHQQHTPASL